MLRFVENLQTPKRVTAQTKSSVELLIYKHLKVRQGLPVNGFKQVLNHRILTLADYIVLCVCVRGRTT